MVATNARDVLSKENELLDKLVATASSFAQSAPSDSVEKTIFNAWVDVLSGHRTINANLISNPDDAAVEAVLQEEAALLQNSLNPISGGSGVAQHWRGHLDKDMKIANQLLL